MDLFQMLKDAKSGKLIENLKCPECNGHGLIQRYAPGGNERISICSCPAGDREAKKRAEENK